jgi:hypothetical protein
MIYAATGILCLLAALITAATPRDHSCKLQALAAFIFTVAGVEHLIAAQNVVEPL